MPTRHSAGLTSLRARHHAHTSFTRLHHCLVPVQTHEPAICPRSRELATQRTGAAVQAPVYARLATTAEELRHREAAREARASKVRGRVATECALQGCGTCITETFSSRLTLALTGYLPGPPQEGPRRECTFQPTINPVSRTMQPRSVWLPPYRKQAESSRTPACSLCAVP